MASKKREPDENTEKTASETAKHGEEKLSADLEVAAWAAWSSSIKGVDQRTWTLLRAAFEAGYEAGHRR